MQKFTRPITREIEVDGDRIALTFDAKGLSFRLVGTRRQPIEVNWPDLICLSVFQGKSPPTPEDLSRALANIGGGKKGAKPEGELPASAAESSGAPAEEPAPEPAMVSSEG